MPETLRLRPPRNQLDRRVTLWWRSRLALFFAPPVAAVFAFGAVLSPALSVIGGVLLVAALATVVLLPAWWYRVHRWEVTDTAVYTRTGYFWQEWRIAPMSRIQTVDTVRGPLQRAFKLATVTVTTASARGAVRIEGLDADLAAALAEELTETTHATPGDAT